MTDRSIPRPPCPGDCVKAADLRGRSLDCSARTPRNSSCTGPRKRTLEECEWKPGGRSKLRSELAPATAVEQPRTTSELTRQAFSWRPVLGATSPSGPAAGSRSPPPSGTCSPSPGARRSPPRCAEASKTAKCQNLLAFLSAQDVRHAGGRPRLPPRVNVRHSSPYGRFSGVDQWPVLGVDRGLWTF